MTQSDLWGHISEPAQHYLDALYTLHKDWQDHAEPQRLSDDYYAVTRVATTPCSATTTAGRAPNF
jgi:hypothetical protein